MQNQVPGVYCLWNKITNQIYVGSSVNIQKRIKQHFSSQCQNPHLKSSIKKYGKENFSITWFKTNDFIAEEQKLLDYVFSNKIPTFNVAVKAGGNPGGSIEGQKTLCLKGKAKDEWRALSEAGGSPKAVPLFLICTKTRFLNRIDSSYEGERLGFGFGCNLSKRSKPDCLNRVQGCLVARSEAEALEKLETWLKITGNDTIDNSIVLTLRESDSQSTLYKLANVSQSNFSQMYKKVIKPSTGEPWRSAVQFKADFNWYGTEVKNGDWFSCIEAL